jgi:hypothetical protein
MHQRIQRYRDSRSDPSLYQSVRSMWQFVSDDYGNRFLIELIQNAHDAHDPGIGKRRSKWGSAMEPVDSVQWFDYIHINISPRMARPTRGNRP